ncbi:unnamed protein product [Owenia fusiformis]|uniref:Uncharacterized protein n=1 Tax=Owenia fusiformis TaxID=6347 RepID=A0A8J1XZA3_OWEFU|nr:unnamed protein product [Owenia fusiformis]
MKSLDKPENIWRSCRMMQAYMGFIGFLVMIAMRVNISMSIICMVNSKEGQNGEFDWDKETQGWILGAYFYGYIITQIPGGWLSDKVGTKRIFGCSLFVCAIATVMTPMGARLGGPYMVMVLRFIVGLSTGCSFPAFHSFWGRWAPVYERTKLILFTNSGGGLGALLGLTVSGALCQIDSSLWPLTFYMPGGLTFFWLYLWYQNVYDSPDEHPTISQQELKHIKAGVTSKKTETLTVPWVDILQSQALWGLLLCHVCANWVVHAMTTSGPTYSKDVFKVEPGANGLISGVGVVVGISSTVISGQLADSLRQSGTWSTSGVRKLFQIFGTLLPSVFTIWLSFLDYNNFYLAMFLMMFATLFTGPVRSGYQVNHVDIAPRFAGTLFGITNTIATIPGMVAPILIGRMTKNGTRDEWQSVAFMNTAINLLGTIFFITMGKGEIQHWAQAQFKYTGLTNKTDSTIHLPDMEKSQKTSFWSFWTSCRMVQAYIAFFGFFFVYGLRVNMSMSIVCMVKQTRETSNQTLANLTSEINQTHDDDDPCVRGLGGKKAGYAGEFEWPKELQGWVLSSFYYGYISTQILGGWLSDSLGPKKVFGVAMFVNMLSTLLTPIGARKGGVIAVIILRVILGMAQGVAFPVFHAFWSRWAPLYERSFLILFSTSGAGLGSLIVMGTSGLLCQYGFDGGWPSIFYIYGGLSFLWLLCWVFFIYDSPQQHPRISPEEMKHIEDGIPQVKRNLSVPWPSILRSPAVWAIIIAHLCANWAVHATVSTGPMYMKEVLNFDPAENGVLSAIVMVIGIVSVVAFAKLADVIRSKKWLSTVAVRKLFQFVGIVLPAILTVWVSFLDCDLRIQALVLLALIGICTGPQKSGYQVNHVDIAPRYAGLLFGITNTIGTIPGMVAPVVITMLTPNGTREEWQVTYLIAVAIGVFGMIAFLILARGVVQPWAIEKYAEDENHVKMEQMQDMLPESNHS